MKVGKSGETASQREQNRKGLRIKKGGGIGTSEEKRQGVEDREG